MRNERLTAKVQWPHNMEDIELRNNDGDGTTTTAKACFVTVVHSEKGHYTHTT